ncbi:flagellar basal body P-ring formation chaperone FlgA [Pantoea septica]|uniref:Flagella basal body P-ring formation protein FlgA n=1 Tax=Pantoea septica TaxID=472695 RepID=A0ABX3ULW7_9GAMM|nr:flagellar basal body P-ring formation chaperone FlgA [Pantoea septica]ORM90373.1 flagella basal body P-ring formation protein FlgA [Pantoea septica]
MKNVFSRWREKLLLLFFIPFTASAQINHTALTKKINALLNGKGHEVGVVRRATLLNAAEKHAALCDEPHLTLSGSQRLTGNRTVVAQCGDKKHFIPIRVEAEGRWWTAARDLKAGSLLIAQDIVQRSGSLANLPDDVMTQPDGVEGAVLTRAVRAGQPLTQSQLRKRWRVSRGDEVEVIAYGSGFHIYAKGKALDNGAVEDAVRVRMKTGQLVSGSVNHDGSVRINL